ncbi:MAG TPA: hypothetical protein IAC14_08780 [Candidatus Scybalomonas excrementigallinarum]|nr:hypothetical protein [Candidatus Scybalomonas excrementigallinarum]
MIVKHKERDYRNADVWGYIDKVNQLAVKEIDAEAYLEMYNNIPKIIETGCNDSCEYLNGVKLSKDIADVNKIFSVATDEIKEELGNVHCENLVFDYSENMPIYAILLYVEDSKEFDNILLLTDQTTYLLNDEGKTIERLV